VRKHTARHGHCRLHYAVEERTFHAKWNPHATRDRGHVVRNMSGPKAWLIGFGIFLYFVVTTTWLPSQLLKGPLASSGTFVQDVVTVAIWGFFLLAGMWGLRSAQRRGMI